jgi:type II secretory pathway pseudopilin PulG
MSFTMMELVVAMLISSIVISIAFYAWSLIGGQLTKRQIQSGKIMECILFQRALRRDVDRAEYIGDSADNRCLLLAMSGHAIRYWIDTSRIIRSRDGITDTFFLGGKIGSIKYVNDSLPLVRSLLIQIEINKESLVLPFSKEYTAGELIRAEKGIHE